MQINEVKKISENLYSITETKSVHRYLILGETSAVLFDLGYGYEPVMPIVKTLTDLPVSVVLSHGDPDHALGSFEFEEIWMHPLDVGKMFQNNTIELRNKAIEYRLNKNPELNKKINKDLFNKQLINKKIKINYLNEGDFFDLGNRKLEVIHTPGHSYGHIMLLDQENRMLFSGDQITSHNIWYFMEPDSQAPFVVARNSLKKILSYEGMIDNIYSAHGLIPIDMSYVHDLYDCLNGELHATYKNDTIFNSFMGTGYQHFYKTVNLIYSKQRLMEDFEFIKNKGGGCNE